jgi:hypothetical protein
LVLRLNQETYHGFEVKPGETVTTGFEAKPSKTITTGFEAKPPKTITTGFEAKPAKTVRVVLRPNHSQTGHLHTTRQANEILQPNKINVEQLKCPRFEFKPHQVNDSS